MDPNFPPITREMILDGAEFALRTDHAFLRDLEATIQKFKAEEQTLLASTTTFSTTSLNWATDRSIPADPPFSTARAPPPHTVAYPPKPVRGQRVFNYTTLPRTNVAFPFYTTYQDAQHYRVTINNTAVYTGVFSDYADFLILLSRYDPRRDWDTAGGGRWIMSMSAPGRGVFTSPEWYYKAQGMAMFTIMKDQDGFDRFLTAQRRAGKGAMVVRHWEVYGLDKVGVRTHVAFEMVKPPVKRKRGWRGGEKDAGASGEKGPGEKSKVRDESGEVGKEEIAETGKEKEGSTVGGGVSE